jgi:hypothetical protein
VLVAHERSGDTSSVLVMRSESHCYIVRDHLIRVLCSLNTLQKAGPAYAPFLSLITLILFLLQLLVSHAGRTLNQSIIIHRPRGGSAVLEEISVFFFILHNCVTLI